MNFEKVSFNAYKKEIEKLNLWFSDDEIEKQYSDLKIPQRGTEYSAGYDFFSPFSFYLQKNKEILIPTGVRVSLNPDCFLLMVPRSGLGFKHYTRFANTVGIIDADYYYSDNEGQMMIKIRNEGETSVHVKKGTGVAQGIILSYIKTDNDAEQKKENRNGGFGSTTK